uniref:Uncharacterized protein n=1 Tax=Anguilla anguilla TaxID=7936 RepID=A0A0E9X6M6_ANGAN
MKNLHCDTSSHRSWHSAQSQNEQADGMQESRKAICLYFHLWPIGYTATSLDSVEQNFTLQHTVLENA